jgi:hypothetical protein
MVILNFYLYSGERLSTLAGGGKRLPMPYDNFKGYFGKIFRRPPSTARNTGLT